MEMMTQLPFAKTHASTGDSCKCRKAPKEEDQGADAISFPTMLQNNSKALASKGSSNTQSEESEKAKVPSLKILAENSEITETKGLAAALSALTIAGTTENISAGEPILADGKISTSDVQMTDLKIDEKIQDIAISTMVKEVSEEQLVSVKATVASPEILSESKELITSEVLPKIIGEMNAAEIIKAVNPGKESSEIKESKSPAAATVDLLKEEKDTALKADIKPGEIPLTSALVDEKLDMTKVDTSEVAQKIQESVPGADAMKMEIVKEAPGTPVENTPVVENPVMARQSSAELDLLSAQASAQKTYQQPTVSAEQAGTPKPTLADLDLDSGSFESNEQKEQSISRILSTMDETTSPIKRSIRGQVLSRVVEHLQEEIGKEKLTIRLNPEKLGQIEVFFQADGDKLSITMSSHGKDAEQAIMEGAKELAEKITDNSVRYNMVDIKVENKGQDQQTKQDSKQEEKREKQGQSEQQQNEGQPSQSDHSQETGAGEWAAFHLGG